MTPGEFRRTMIEPGAAWTEAVCGVTSSTAAKRFLLAVAAKESDLSHRYQVLNSGAAGPARSFWQGEVTGGMVRGIFRFPAQRITDAGRALCAAAHVQWNEQAIWRAIEGHDLLAYGLARLLLLTDPYAVPETESGAWTCYMDRLWRPGAPNKPKWAPSWSKALGEYPLG
ncbi:hypothetical protein HMPREF9946_02177 [Acetobacteraceae bacterium AT-5844]|nr:hypothetical protein HMPREF9946_02177 [Acetobacteraceae bacterium AT-5844]